jgi:UPF0271 protein
VDIDLNADLGEGFGPWRMGDDDALLQIVSSANIACGFHAGDPVIMERTVRIAAARGIDIDIGAHVGFPDLMGFGRRPLQCDPAELASYVLYQLGALAGIATACGRRMSHMSFHGALGNMVAADAELAMVLVGAVARFDAGLIISSSPSQAIEAAGDHHGLRVATSFLADRACDEAGLLIPRKLPDAVIHDADTVLARVVQLLEEGTVTTYAGKQIPLRASSILLHGDTPGAVALAAAVRARIEAVGGRIVPISRQVCAAA